MNDAAEILTDTALSTGAAEARKAGDFNLALAYEDALRYHARGSLRIIAAARGRACKYLGDATAREQLALLNA